MTTPSERLLPVSVDNKYGYINLRGELVVPCQYGFASEFSEGLAYVQKQFNYEEYEKLALQEYIFINQQIQEVGALKCFSCYHGFSEGLLAFERDDKWGYVDATLQVVISPSFDNADDFVDGLARAAADNWTAWGIIDRTGKWVIPPKYRYVWSFQKGEAVAGFSMTGERWGLLDRQGNIVLDARFDRMGWPSRGMLTAGARIGEYLKEGIINERGEWLVEPRWDDTDGGFTDDLMSAAVDGKWGVVSREGEWVIKPQYTNAQKFVDGLCNVYVGGRRDGDYCLWDGKCGFINKVGEMVIEPRFDAASDFEDGVCKVELIDGDPKDNLSRYGYIDTQGRYIWEPTR
jgi:hypothetical protein